MPGLLAVIVLGSTERPAGGGIEGRAGVAAMVLWADRQNNIIAAQIGQGR